MSDHAVGACWLSRERAAGYDPEILRHGKILLGGAGAGANNVALTLALSTVGHVLVVDFDEYEDHNATRSPFYPAAAEQVRLGLGKAKVMAHKMAAMAKDRGTGDPMKTSYLAGYVQQLPLAIFRAMDVVVNGSDNAWARAYLAEQAFLAGKPFIDAGFRGEHLQVGVFVPGDPSQEPCWRCLQPTIVPDARFSCEAYAVAVERQGLTPAMQAVAQAAGAMQAEHAILALHNQFPLRNAVFRLNLRTGEALTYTVTKDPLCPSAWHRVGELQPLPMTCDDTTTWQQIHDAVAASVGDDEVQLKPLVDLVWNMPCRDCKRPMAVRASAWLYTAAPRCTACGGPFALLPPHEALIATTEYYSVIDHTRRDALGRTLCDFGVHAGDLLLAEPSGIGSPRLVELVGNVTHVGEPLVIDVDAADVVASLASSPLASPSNGGIADGDRCDAREKELIWT